MHHIQPIQPSAGYPGAFMHHIQPIQPSAGYPGAFMHHIRPIRPSARHSGAYLHHISRTPQSILRPKPSPARPSPDLVPQDQWLFHIWQFRQGSQSAQNPLR
jgi:hypothetical protein